MRGSSGIPKSDINSTSAPITTGDTSAELKNSKEPYKRLKTRKPPVVKEREPAYLQRENAKKSKESVPKEISQAPNSKENINPLSAQNKNQHTAPVVSSLEKRSQVSSEPQPDANKLTEMIEALVLRIQPALVEKDLAQLEIAIKGLETNHLRFDRPPLVNYPEIKDFARTGLAKVIGFGHDAISDQTENLLIRMIRLGCSPSVTDKFGNSVLMSACKAGRSTLVKVLLTECPNLKKDWLNVHGENAAMMANKYGNVHLYPLLEQAGISHHPENPVINFYLSTFENEYDGSSDSEIDEYLDLFKQNNYMNLADANGQTILFHAVIHEDLGLVSFLCHQNQFLNVALRDVYEKSVFDYIKQIKDPHKREKLYELVYDKSKETGWLYELASYNYLKDV